MWTQETDLESDFGPRNQPLHPSLRWSPLRFHRHRRVSACILRDWLPGIHHLRLKQLCLLDSHSHLMAI
jgi:hypothetical protein